MKSEKFEQAVFTENQRNKQGKDYVGHCVLSQGIWTFTLKAMRTSLIHALEISLVAIWKMNLEGESIDR